MENEKLQVVLPEGQNTLIIREGQAQNILDVKPPLKIAILGIIGAPVEFLTRRFSFCSDYAAGKETNPIFNHFDPTRCHVIVDREDVSVTLVIDENDEYKCGTVIGRLEKHPKFIEFGINEKTNWEPNELGQFLKMNRAFFPDKSKNMMLVSELKNFIAKIDSTVEKQKEDKGSFKDNFSGVVTSNLPESFSVEIPIFKGVKADIIEVEFYATVSGRTVWLNLISPAANEIYETIRDGVIDEQIQKIREIAPNMVIIEK